MFKHVHVIVNPASGKDRPILNTLNTVFADSDIEWDVSITKAAGDGRRRAKELAEAGIDLIAVYGGDGTIMEVAEGLLGTGIPLAILPGGTANAAALALNIPTDLTAAASLIRDGEGTVRTLDMGQLGDRCFLIAVGIGIPGELAESADRDAKDRLGPLAYGVATVDALRKSEAAQYHLVLDGEEIMQEGVTCLILNSGNFGIPGLTVAPNIDMADGLLDVVVIPSAGLAALVSAAATMATAVVRPEPVEAFPRWQARVVKVTPEPLQAVQADGEVLEPGPIEARVLPGALHVLVPQTKEA